MNFNFDDQLHYMIADNYQNLLRLENTNEYKRKLQSVYCIVTALFPFATILTQLEDALNILFSYFDAVSKITRLSYLEMSVHAINLETPDYS